MAVDIDLMMARREAESGHKSTFAVYRRTGGFVTDETTLEETAEYAVVHAKVRGKFQFSDAQPRDVQTPGRKVAETGFAWHTSVSTLGVLTDDEVECTASPDDPEHVGIRVRIAGPFLKSGATARRFKVEELT